MCSFYVKQKNAYVQSLSDEPNPPLTDLNRERLATSREVHELSLDHVKERGDALGRCWFATTQVETAERWVSLAKAI